MEGQKNYIISTIKDIAVKIPDDKLDVFFADLRAAIGQQKAVMAMAKEILGEEGGMQMIDALREEMVWVDDGKTEVTSTITVNKTPIASVTIDYSKPAQ
jgi:hypothetical protein